jgi:hypothetical protein
MPLADAVSAIQEQHQPLVHHSGSGPGRIEATYPAAAAAAAVWPSEETVRMEMWKRQAGPQSPRGRASAPAPVAA